jgi:hypothetical protein
VTRQAKEEMVGRFFDDLFCLGFYEAERKVLGSGKNRQRLESFPACQRFTASGEFTRPRDGG